MSKFEVLCATMHQNDFSKIKEMNVHSDIIFANQADLTSYQEFDFDGHKAKMISTQTRGVGINRNLALCYATADICLFADDDLVYCDDMEERIVAEFDAHPDADVIVFHLDTDDNKRKQIKYSKTRKHGRFSRMPWGCVRIAFRLNSVRKANVWFNTLFGGGCVFPSGEDSLWLIDAKRKGLTFYVSKETIGKVSFEESTWFTGYDEKFFYGKGAFYAASHPKTFSVWSLYFACRTHSMTEMSMKSKIKWMNKGRDGYRSIISYQDFKNNQV